MDSVQSNYQTNYVRTNVLWEHGIQFSKNEKSEKEKVNKINERRKWIFFSFAVLL